MNTKLEFLFDGVVYSTIGAAIFLLLAAIQSDAGDGNTGGLEPLSAAMAKIFGVLMMIFLITAMVKIFKIPEKKARRRHPRS